MNVSRKRIVSKQEFDSICRRCVEELVYLDRFCKVERAEIMNNLKHHYISEKLLDSEHGPTKLLLAAEFWKLRYFYVMQRVESAAAIANVAHKNGES